MKIICVEANFPSRIAELNCFAELEQQKIITEPFCYIKPDTALLRNNDPFYIPLFSKDISYASQLVVRINRMAKAIETKFAHRCYSEIGIGINFTAEDILQDCRKRGLPWELSHSFDYSAAISLEFISKEDLKDIIEFELRVNNTVQQSGRTSNMIDSIDEVISKVSKMTTLKIGDMIFLGSPSSQNQVNIGDHFQASIAGRTLLDFYIK